MEKDVKSLKDKMKKDLKRENCRTLSENCPEELNKNARTIIRSCHEELNKNARTIIRK
jgi:hypothetical protein